MAIPFNKDNIFRWYDGSSPDRYTLFCGENLNKGTLQVLENTLSINENIDNILNGKTKADTLFTSVLNADKCNIGNTEFDTVNNVLTFTNNTAKISGVQVGNLYTSLVDIDSMQFKKIPGIDEVGIYNKDDKLCSIKMGYLDTKLIKSDLSTITFTVEGDEKKEAIFTYSYADSVKDTLVAAGTFQALDGCYSFSNLEDKRRDDAIVFDDDNTGSIKNSYLFYADGAVKNSTIVVGDLKTIGADVAEYYDIDDNYEFGTVIGIGSSSYEGTKYTKGQKLLGVVSDKPGTLLNQENNYNNQVPIALKGRVLVRINGTAKKGDYIVADGNGKAKSVSDVTFEEYKLVVGIALEDASDIVLIKV